MMKGRNILALLVWSVMVFFCSFGQVNAEESKATESYELRWGTTKAGGSWLIIGNAVLEDIKKAYPNITGSTLPGTSTANPIGVHTGKMNIAFGNADNTALGWNGERQFKKIGKIRDIRNVLAVFPLTTHIVVRANSDIRKIEDLKGKRVSVGPKGFSNNTEFARLLKFYGMSYDDMKMQFLSPMDAAQQFIDGHLDCLAFVVVPPPYPVIINAAASREVRFLSIPDDKVEKMLQYAGVGKYTLPPGVYQGQDYPIKGILTVTHLMVHKDMPDWVVRAVLKTYLNNFERYKKVLSAVKFMKKENICMDVGIPFHPAAIQYYKEIGYMK
jgi:TRAP transporter TAXI family solute receptor